MTITGVPVVQDNTGPSPYITDEDVNAVNGLQNAAEITAVNYAAELQNLIAQAPAWVMQQLPKLKQVDLLSVGNIDTCIKKLRDLYRPEYLASAQVPSNKYQDVIITLTSMRALVLPKYNLQQLNLQNRNTAIETISGKFKTSGKARKIEQQRIDDLALAAAEKKAKAADARNLKRRETYARATIVNSFSNLIRNRRPQPAPL
ncbi:hypothetical protein T492DRAFT_846888 [Pavlovales sp. CCMP2436]|nr:hypothetical protein T492DRAFT_846888 [Pavlovales sp. CCMP2436]